MWAWEGSFWAAGSPSFTPNYLGRFACDTVVNYKVVVANGTIVDANRTNNPELWKALKGGGGHFGIVTRFDLEAIPAKDLFFELWYLTAGVGHSDTIVRDAVVAYADYHQSKGDDALVVFWVHDASIVKNSTAIAVVHVNTTGDSETVTAFDEIRALPAISKVSTAITMAEQTATFKRKGGAR